MRNAMFFMAVGAALVSPGLSAEQILAPVNVYAAPEANWQRLRQQDARVRARGGEKDDEVSLETMWSQHTSVKRENQFPSKQNQVNIG
jgi:hypothetical protein